MIYLYLIADPTYISYVRRRASLPETRKRIKKCCATLPNPHWLKKIRTGDALATLAHSYSHTVLGPDDNESDISKRIAFQDAGRSREAATSPTTSCLHKHC